VDERDGGDREKKYGRQGEESDDVPAPDFLMRAAAIFMPVARLVLQDLGRDRDVRGDKARNLLEWKWMYTNEEAVVAAAESLLRFDEDKMNNGADAIYPWKCVQSLSR
jgi:hypothetical protein